MWCFKRKESPTQGQDEQVAKKQKLTHTPTVVTHDRTIKFYKVLNNKMNHHGFQYQDGFNVLAQKFNDSIYDDCGSGGFYITTKAHIDRFLNYGIYICKVELPYDNPDFKLVKLPSGKWRTNMLYITEKYSLYLPETLQRFELMHLDFISGKIYSLSILGDKTLLTKWLPLLPTHFNISQIIDKLASVGNIDMLNWWKNSDKTFNYSENALTNSAMNGNVEVLKWFVENKLPLKYNSTLFDLATIHGKVEFLDTWCDLKLSFSDVPKDIYVTATYHGRLKMLNWWAKHYKKPVYNESVKQALEYIKEIKIVSNTVCTKLTNWWFTYTLLPC